MVILLLSCIYGNGNCMLLQLLVDQWCPAWQPRHSSCTAVVRDRHRLSLCCQALWLDGIKGSIINETMKVTMLRTVLLTASIHVGGRLITTTCSSHEYHGNLASTCSVLLVQQLAGGWHFRPHVRRAIWVTESPAYNPNPINPRLTLNLTLQSLLTLPY